MDKMIPYLVLDIYIFNVFRCCLHCYYDLYGTNELDLVDGTPSPLRSTSDLLMFNINKTLKFNAFDSSYFLKVTAFILNC